jgi:hypothetical protein
MADFDWHSEKIARAPPITASYNGSLRLPPSQEKAKKKLLPTLELASASTYAFASSSALITIFSILSMG